MLSIYLLFSTFLRQLCYQTLTNIPIAAPFQIGSIANLWSPTFLIPKLELFKVFWFQSQRYPG
jgi:hypothetical protein